MERNDEKSQGRDEERDQNQQIEQTEGMANGEDNDHDPKLIGPSKRKTNNMAIGEDNDHDSGLIGPSPRDEE